MKISSSKNNKIAITIRNEHLNLNLFINKSVLSFLRNVLLNIESSIFLKHYEMFYKNNILTINAKNINFKIDVDQNLIDQFCDIIYDYENFV